jgi:hypothetical protein
MMKFHNYTILISMTLLMGLTACSTGSGAEADTQTQQQAQTQQQGEDHAAHHPDGDEAEDQKMTEKQEMMKKMCPMQVEGTTRQVVKLENAVAMDFTTTSDVAELRQRVQKMAKKHEKMHSEGGMKGQQGEKGKMMKGQMTEEQKQMRKQMMQMMTDVTVATTQIDGGTRMTFTPKDATKADSLYQMMQKHSQMMDEKGQCPMMQMMGDEPMEHQHK